MLQLQEENRCLRAQLGQIDPKGMSSLEAGVGRGEGLGLLWTQPSPPPLQPQGSVGLGWPGPSGISMGCYRSSCWRTRGSGRAHLSRGAPCPIPTPWAAPAELPAPYPWLPFCPALLPGLVLPRREGASPIPPAVAVPPLTFLGPAPPRKEKSQLQSSQARARDEQRLLAQQVHELER